MSGTAISRMGRRQSIPRHHVSGSQPSPTAMHALKRLVAVHGIYETAHRLGAGDSTIELLDGGGFVREDTADRIEAALLAERCACLGCTLARSVDAARRAKGAR